VYVSSDKVDGVLEALRERLATVKVGDPSREEVGMGPVATKQQLDDVRAGITRLQGGARSVCGGPEQVDAIGTGKKGFFVAPTLMHATEPRADDAVHQHEVFGPVATVMPYDGTAKMAATLVAWGGGGLVSSVYSDDKAFVRDTVLGIAPLHGRVTIGSSKTASQAIPPGTVMPQLLHGGPGRAGGGEELGARRGLALYMQRVALQGDRALVEAIAGKRASCRGPLEP
jgi:oxepin-CoA hydrolase/3-oxo-5,6-dehydrosuberyl-CoA semialdehyde dehydrogenase